MSESYRESCEREIRNLIGNAVPKNFSWNDLLRFVPEGEQIIAVTPEYKSHEMRKTSFRLPPEEEIQAVLKRDQKRTKDRSRKRKKKTESIRSLMNGSRRDTVDLTDMITLDGKSLSKQLETNLAERVRGRDRA